ncbi:MAG: hypothetical protein KA789_03410, partial [Parabacteroides sp.]|nr:hypothetical protein [Parabacteroides sp.]
RNSSSQSHPPYLAVFCLFSSMMKANAVLCTNVQWCCFCLRVARNLLLSQSVFCFWKQSGINMPVPACWCRYMTNNWCASA